MLNEATKKIGSGTRWERNLMAVRLAQIKDTNSRSVFDGEGRFKKEEACLAGERQRRVRNSQNNRVWKRSV
jgi:2-methylcitrate dehydratase PrpD